MSSRQGLKRFPRLALVAGLLAFLGMGTDRAEAQVYGGFGYYGGPGYYGGVGYYGGLPAIGFPGLATIPGGGFGLGFGGLINPYAYLDSWAHADYLRMSTYAMNISRYNLATASLATTAAADNLMSSAAYNELAWRRPPTVPETGGWFNVHSTLPGGVADDAQEKARSNLLASTTQDGDVIWPSYAPVQGNLFAKRREANQAIKAVIGPNRARGQAPVSDVVQALHALANYSGPAVEQLRYDEPGNVSTFLDFVNMLNQGLHALASEPLATDGKGFAGGEPPTSDKTPTSSDGTRNDSKP